MAFRVGITGLPNTGKSFGWSTYKGDDVFAICPSSKIIHVRKADNKLLSPVNVAVAGLGDSNTEIMQKKGFVTEGQLLAALSESPFTPAQVKVTGDYVICSEIKYVAGIKKFVDKYMPEKKIIVTTDFTHFINYIMHSSEFRNRKAGGEAFQRFWDMAADMLGNVIISSDSLKNVQLDFTEFHSEYNSDLGQFEIYTSGGKMLTEKFKPESYFDIMLYSYVVPYEVEKDETKRFKYITIKKDGYDGRGLGLFSDVNVDGAIPNDMSLVIERLRKYLS